MSDMELNKIESKEIWVDLFEAAEITGYNYHSMRRLIYGISQYPEDEREIRLRKRTSRWELWLPDLIDYVRRPGRGQRAKKDEDKNT